MTQIERAYIDSNGRLDAYAWPGGYPIAYYCPNGDVLCADCARRIIEANRADALLIALGSELGYDQFDEDGDVIGADPVLSAMRDAVGITRERSETPTGCDAYWEGPPIQCDECNATIESAYGDPDASDDNPEA